MAISHSTTELFGPATAGVIADAPEVITCDIAIVGSGMAGATVAWALRDSGARVLVIEQGDFVPRERENWSAREVWQLGRYKNAAPWLDRDGNSFLPGYYQYVGGNSKFFGTTLARMRERDFGPVQTHDGLSPAWPVTYEEMEPHYGTIEQLFHAHAVEGDPLEPWRSTPAPLPALKHEPVIGRLAERFRRQGLHPFTLAQGLDTGAGGSCVLCATCDGYPCLVDGKGDADLSVLRPALRSSTVRLLTRATVTKVETEADGATVSALQLHRDGRSHRVIAERYVIAGGAVNSAALLLRSRNAAHPNGIANGSDQVGRNYMAHTISSVIGIRPGRRLQIEYQKTLGLNDWYFEGPDSEYPLGNIAALGKLFGPTIKPARPWIPMPILDWIAGHSVDLFAQTEDVPLAENRIKVEPDGRIRLIWQATNVEPHNELVRRLRRALRRAGFPFTFSERFGIDSTAHQCGTARMGDDPATSVVNAECRAHEVSNMWIVDAATFPSSAAVNPALTIAANALRVAHSAALIR